MAEPLGRRTAVTDTRVGGSIVSKRNKIFLGWRTAGNYEVAKEKYRAAIIGGAGRAARTSGRRKKKRREEKGKGGWEGGRKPPGRGITRDNWERGTNERGREGETCVRSEGGKRKGARVPWCKFVLASGRLHASNPLVSATSRRNSIRGGSIRSTSLREIRVSIGVCVHVTVAQEFAKANRNAWINSLDWKWLHTLLRTG